MVEPTATARLQIDLSALVKNWKALNKLSGCAGAAVKANAYGLGATEVVKALYNAGCRDFFVANWNEANQLKNIIPQNMISVLNGIDSENIAFAKAHQFKPVLNTPNQIAMWRENGGALCDVMLDSGINRLGIGQEQIDTSLFQGLNIDIVMSHLASADENNARNEIQRKTFNTMRARINGKRNSLANSAGIMLGHDYHYDLTRPGLALYGGILRDELQNMISSVIKIEAKVLQVRQAIKGDKVGYNGTYVCDKDMKIVTAALGYADGYFRAFSNIGSAYFDDNILPVIGRVSMDLIILDANKVDNIGEASWITIEFNLPNVSKMTNISQYELLTGLGNRYKASYV